MIIATILLFALGHMIRDGIPPLGSTHAARGLGGFCCILGGFLLTWDWCGVLLGAAVYAGFYSDMLHGEGHRARGWKDVLPLSVSGMTSLAPLALAAALAVNPWLGLIVLAGAIKPPVWFAAWRLPVKWSGDPEGVWVPTRVAAVTWGAVVGVLIVIIVVT